MRNPFASRLWSNAAFVRVWSAATISIFGSLITGIAFPFVAIVVLGAGALEVALLRTLDLGATLIFGLVAGAWVDRLRRRPVLIWADLGRAVLLGSVPVAFVAGVLNFPQLLIVTAAAAILTTFFDAADNAYLPAIVEREQLVEANSAVRASGSVAEFVSFGIAGFLVQILSGSDHDRHRRDVVRGVGPAPELDPERGGTATACRRSRVGPQRDPRRDPHRPRRSHPAGVHRR